MRYSRRQFLAATALGAHLLAGCVGQEAPPTSGPTADGSTDTPTASPTQTRTAESDRTATGGQSTATRSETATGGPTETASETPTGTVDSPTETTSTETEPTPTATPQVGQTVVVGPNGTPRFEPESFTVTRGATVRWEWEDDGHNVRPSGTPEDSTWTGTPGGDGTTYDTGYVYEYTFQVAGEYEYYCAPHRSLGMTGSFTVE